MKMSLETFCLGIRKPKRTSVKIKMTMRIIPVMGPLINSCLKKSKRSSGTSRKISLTLGNKAGISIERII